VEEWGVRGRGFSDAKRKARGCFSFSIRKTIMYIMPQLLGIL